jgi:hypothetical protein
MHGANVWFDPQPLMTVIPQPGSMTMAQDSGYRSARRLRDRQGIWQDIAQWRQHGTLPVVPIDLADVRIVDAINPRRLSVAADLPITAPARAQLTAQLQQIQAKDYAA